MVAELTILENFINLLMDNPSPERIMDFKASKAEDERLQYLVRKSKEVELSLSEQVELNETFKANHYVAMAKIKAYDKLKN
jgi:hypothetical protein